MTGLYVHVPFCARACPYCDFDFVVGRDPDIDGWVAALSDEIDARGLAGLRARTLYFGGGTPSLLGAAGLARVMAMLAERVDLTATQETTIELNPEHVDDALLDAVVEHGFRRVSLGAQTLDPAGLVQLGRVHDARRAVASIAACHARGLAVSADLIVGWPGQTATQATRDLDALRAAGAGHLSVYALTVEPGTNWEALVRRGKRQLPDDDEQASLLALIAQRLAQAGWEHYEVASYAESTATRAQHNLGYWQTLPYVGLGPSAASAHYDERGAVTRRTNARGFTRWRQAPGQPGEVEQLTPEAAAVEALWLGLRVLTGLDLAGYLRRFPGIDRAWVSGRVRTLVERGDLLWDGEARLRVAPDRWLFHDAIAAQLL